MNRCASELAVSVRRSSLLRSELSDRHHVSFFHQPSVQFPTQPSALGATTTPLPLPLEPGADFAASTYTQQWNLPVTANARPFRVSTDCDSSVRTADLFHTISLEKAMLFSCPSAGETCATQDEGPPGPAVDPPGASDMLPPPAYPSLACASG